MGKVRFIQQNDWTNTLTWGLYRQNYNFHLIDENDKILYTLEEESSTFTKLWWSDDITAYEATLYLGLKSKPLVKYKKGFKIPSWFLNYSRPTLEIFDLSTNTNLGKIINPAPKCWSCKGHLMEVRDSSDQLAYQIFTDKACEWNISWPLPFWKCSHTDFKIEFPIDSLIEGEALEMANSLNLRKVSNGCWTDWCGKHFSIFLNSELN